jgi:murein DD-endopeptidase MepM/ murein hydrolase activator NlpD
VIALQYPLSIELPYKLIGHFPIDKPRALGFRFRALRGEKITFILSRKSLDNAVVYADLFKENGTANKPSFLISTDTSGGELNYEIEETGNYILRLQPELFRPAAYDLVVSAGPSLDFPVPGKKAITGSFWGDDRDGGNRRHEGIDIFAPKRTPVIATSDGVVTGADEGGIGGKTVWLRLINKKITLYYAHLDEQLVHAGQFVKKGDTLGLVGNTGNAKFTPSHLHFGIYTNAGPIDPLPFVKKSTRSAPTVQAKNLSGYIRLKRSQIIGKADTVLNANTMMKPLAVTSKIFIAELPDGKILQVPLAAAKPI